MAVVSEVTLKTIDWELNYREAQPTCEGGYACEKEDRQRRTHSAHLGLHRQAQFTKVKEFICW